MPVLPGRRAGQPLAGTVLQGRLAVEAGGKFHPQPWPRTRHARDKSDIDFLRLCGQQATLGKHPGDTPARQTPPGHLGIGILHRGAAPRHPGDKQGFGAGRGATVVTAGFQGNVKGRPARSVASGLQRVNFGMLPAGTYVPALADDLAILDDDTADARIGAGREETALGQAQGACHVLMVGGAERRGHQRPDGGAERETSRTTLENSSTSSKLRYTEANRT